MTMIRIGATSRAALFAGISLLAMAVAAGFAFGLFHGQIRVAGDPAATALALAANNGVYLLEIALWWLVVALDITVGLAVYVLFKSTGPRLAFAAMALRVLYALGLGAATIVLSTAGAAGAEGLSRINTFDQIWSLSLIVFGLHLVALGVLALKSREVPVVLAWLVLGAGVCYAVLHSLDNLGPATLAVSAVLTPILSAPMAVAELWLAVWLLYRTVKAARSAAAAS